MIWNFILYLLYGLTFFTLGVAILSRDVRLSELGIAKIIWLLAVFGIVHGFHEWLELLEQLNPEVITPTFTFFRRIVVGSSFIFLLYFGLFLNIITFYGDKALKTIPLIIKMVVGTSALILLVVAIYLDFGSSTDINIRRLIAFPGGLLSGIGLIMYSRTVRAFSREVATNFILAGSFMICYAFLTGLIPSDVIIPFGGIKIILFRGLSAFLIMFFTIRALSVFSLEQRELVNEKLLRFSQSEKLTSMGILAAGIADEINNPLTNVALNVEALKDLVSDDAKITRNDVIVIETMLHNGYVLATITDTGHGIAEENISKVFDPFFTTKEVGKGTGLGLSVCYNIIKQHGGEISLTSTVQETTIVTVSFPVGPYDS